MVCAVTGAWAEDYVKYNETTKVYDVLVTASGSFSSLVNNQNYPDDAVFHFESGCINLSDADLARLSGDGENGKYYIDLYDVPTSEAFENVIKSAVNIMANNDKKCRGLLLPANPNSVGTMLICNGAENVNKGKATCGQFIAYHNQGTTMAHIYFAMPQNSANPTYEQRLEKLKSIMDSHGIVTTVYGISTNKYTEITNISGIINNSDATIIHTYDNELVSQLNQEHQRPSIVAKLDNAGDFATAFSKTGIQNTPNIDRLKLCGSVGDTDIQAINEFTTGGPRVIDLSSVTSSLISKQLLAKLSNPNIEYIILPSGMTEPVVGDYANLPNLKCVISSNKSGDEDHALTAYVKVAGSLAEARCIATGNNNNNNSQFKPISQGLTTVKLSGNLSANDLATGDNGGLRGEQNTITSIDLEQAYFATSDHMKFGDNGGAGLTNLREVKLPTDSRMKIIPTECFHNVGKLQSVHIPYNFEKIKARAFEGTDLTHITTEDANGALIDNGPNTYTFSANINELGEPNQNNYVFPEGKLVTDVFCLAMTTPKCYKGSFPPNMVYANGGIYDGVYCREKYIKYDNSDPATGNPVSAITMLHFPSQESYKNATGDNTDDGYNNMQSLYTDPSRNYAKKDQTGAVDANGKPLTWPDQGECRSTHDDLALKGYLWSNYPQKNYENSGDGHLVSLGNREGSQGAFYSDYVGWHEFVLACATYFEPDEIIENEKIVREYEETGYYTFCIPFNMNYNQVVEMLGVPKSTDKVINKLNGNVVTDDLMPEIRQLSSVTRKKGENGKSNIVFLRMTPNLYEANHPGQTAYLKITYNENTETHELTDAHPYGTGYTFGEQLTLIGGRPYIIKAYKRKQLDKNGVDLYKIKGQNLGKYVMEHYADQFGVESSIVENKTYQQFLCYEQLYNNKTNENERAPKTLRFAKPYEEHRIQAVRDGENSAYLTYETDENGQTVQKKYFYTMVGQFWQQPLPQYCLYMSKGNWYRYTNVPENIEDRYTWDPFKCVIMATEEIAGTKGEGYRDEQKSVYPNVIGQTDDKLDGVFSLAFLDGRNDDDFDGNGTFSRYIFGLDDDIVEFDEEGNEVTAIERLDGEDIVPAGSKIYNVAGQYVGESLNGLTKGLYIVNGKKIVVK